MSREEAMKELSYIIDEMPSMECADWIEAISMAIEALEQEPCEDCISRQAVDEYITNLLSGYLYDEERTRLEDLTAFVWELPSVQPTRPKGEDEYKKGYSDGFRDCLDKNV